MLQKHKNILLGIETLILYLLAMPVSVMLASVLPFPASMLLICLAMGWLGVYLLCRQRERGEMLFLVLGLALILVLTGLLIWDSAETVGGETVLCRSCYQSFSAGSTDGRHVKKTGMCVACDAVHQRFEELCEGEEEETKAVAAPIWAATAFYRNRRRNRGFARRADVTFAKRALRGRRLPAIACGLLLRLP